MALVQLDLFHWSEQAERSEIVAYNHEVSAESLANALIKFFGHWVGTKPRLLGDDWTVCETLVGIHKVFTREQLSAVTENTWSIAWHQFETFYLTKRGHSDLYCRWPAK